MTTAEREQQRDNALALAQGTRMANARLREEIAAMTHREGRERVALLLLQPAGPALSFPIGRLLKSIRLVGEDGMAQYLRYAGVFSPTKRVGALTPRQRTALATALRNRPLVFPTTKYAA